MADHFLSTTYLLQKAAKHALEDAEAACSQLALSARQYLLLEIAATGDELSQAEIGARLGVDVTVLGKLLADLETRGLVQRTRAPEDRRRHDLRITMAGSKLLTRAARAMASAEATTLAQLSAPQRRDLHGLLVRLSAQDSAT